MLRALLMVVLGLLPAFEAAAQVYRYVDENGVVHYTDQPPSKAAEPVELPALRTYTPESVALPERQDASKAPDAAGELRYRVFRIVAPVPDETLRGAERIVPVAVVSEPILAPGHRVQFYLDGQPQGAAKTATSEAFRGVDRGMHTVSAAIVDAKGRVLKRADPVTVHVKPPIVR